MTLHDLASKVAIATLIWTAFAAILWACRYEWPMDDDD